MTAAGQAQVAFAPEQSFNGSLASSPGWFQPGVNISVTGPTLDRGQEPVRQPNKATPAAHRPGPLEGSATVEFEPAGDAQEWEQFVFHGTKDSADALPAEGGAAPSFRAYFSSTIINGSEVDYVATGAIVTEAEITDEEGGELTVSLTIEFAEKGDGSSAPSDSDISVPDADTVFPYHSGQVETSAAADPQVGLDSVTVTISSLHRLRRELDQVATGAVVGAIEVEVDIEGTFTETDQLNLAVTGTGKGELSGETDITLTFSRALGGTTSLTYVVAGARPDSYEWSNLVSPGDDHTENVTFVAENVTAASGTTATTS
jgi:hypothetical protein